MRPVLIRPRSAGAGFTLIEVLVVVAIIALLISVLLPSLRLARARAKSTACLSNLHHLGVSAFQYAQEFREYIPPLKTWLDLPHPENQYTGPKNDTSAYGGLGTDDMRVYYPKYGKDLLQWVCPGAGNQVREVDDLRDSYGAVGGPDRRGSAYEYIPFMYNVVYRPLEPQIYQISTVNAAVEPLRLSRVRRPADVCITHDADDPDENWSITDQDDPHAVLKGGNMNFADGHAVFIRAGNRSHIWLEWTDRGRPRVRR